jgi:enterochelin esterase family protein
MTIRTYLAISCLLAAGLVWSQQANVNLDYNPQKNTENLIPFSAALNSPDVRDDGTVTFRLKAPAAKEVLLSGVAILTALGKSGRPVPFTKGDDGVWTLTVGPLKPDMYIYYFDFEVDGVRIADPNNTIAGFTAMPPYGQLVVHGSGPAYYDARNVPHGTVTRHVYHSDVTSGERELYVYTPPRPQPRQTLSHALSRGRKRRSAFELGVRRAREFHDGQPAGGEKGSPDGNRHPQQSGSPPEQSPAHGADVQVV